MTQAGGTLSVPSTWGRRLIVLIAFYLVGQLCDAIGWAIKGQGRASYWRDDLSGIMLKAVKPKEDWLRTRITQKAGQVLANRDQNDKKVTMMAVAHRAAANFVGGLIVLSLVGVLASFEI